MIILKIWERYFLRETIKVFILVLCTFYGLYILIDYTSHFSNRQNHHSPIQWSEFFQHYFYGFILHFDVLIPFAIMIASIQRLCQLSVNNELIPLLASGIKLKRLLRPFVFFGLFATVLTYLNMEYLLPQALSQTRHTHDVHTAIKNKKNHHLFVQHILLKDQSTLLFQDYDHIHKLFFDAYWIKSFDDIYRIKFLKNSSDIATGHHVDHLTRNEKGKMVKKASYEEKQFPHLKFNQKVLVDTITPPKELPISVLWKKSPPSHQNIFSEKESAIAATLYQKLATPWLCLLAVIIPAPFCVRFTRNLPVFLIYAFSIFILVASYLILESSLILGSRQVISPLWAVGTPFALLMGISIGRFAAVKS